MPATDVTSHNLRNAGMASTRRTRSEVGALSCVAIAPHLLRGVGLPLSARVSGGTHNTGAGRSTATAGSQWPARAALPGVLEDRRDHLDDDQREHQQEERVEQP